MDRREFLSATAVAAVSPLPRLDALNQSAARQYIELWRYHLLPGTKQRAFTTFHMLTFSDVSARDKAWASFGKDPEWKTLSGDPQYRDNVSAISDIILQPTAYSQI